MNVLNIKVIDTDSIEDESMLENAILAQYDYVPTDGYRRWYTSWRDGGNTICSNSPEHSALSNYLIENGCGDDESVILSF